MECFFDNVFYLLSEDSGRLTWNGTFSCKTALTERYLSSPLTMGMTLEY